jgi:hypothetical protein
MEFKDFFIAVGQPGAYTKDMAYDEVIALNNDFNIKIKHAPFSLMSKIKNVVVQSWKDEDGDDVFLPRIQDSATGQYKPAITHEAVEYNATFVLYEPNNNEAIANKQIRSFIQKIEGRWLKIWDEYTQIGYEGVYLLDVDDDPTFRRREHDSVIFELNFKINGVALDSPFDNIQTN